MTRYKPPRTFFVAILAGMALHLLALVVHDDLAVRGAITMAGLTLWAVGIVVLWLAGRARADLRSATRERWIRRRRDRYLKAE